MLPATGWQIKDGKWNCWATAWVNPDPDYDSQRCYTRLSTTDPGIGLCDEHRREILGEDNG